MRSLISRKHAYSGTTRLLIETIVCAYIADAFMKQAFSLIYGESALITAARALSLFTSIVLGRFVWQGYKLAQLILATEMLSIGSYTLYLAFSDTTMDENHYTVFVTAGTLRVAFGTILFLLHFFGRQKHNKGPQHGVLLGTNKRKAIAVGLLTTLVTVISLYTCQTWLAFGASILLLTIPGIIVTRLLYKRTKSVRQESTPAW